MQPPLLYQLNLAAIKVDAAAVSPDGAWTFVRDMFLAHPKLRSIPVIDEDNLPEGVVSRDAFFTLMATAGEAPFFLDRPINRVMNRNPWLLSARPILMPSPQVCAKCPGTTAQAILSSP
jgi:hypothetical protein